MSKRRFETVYLLLVILLSGLATTYSRSVASALVLFFISIFYLYTNKKPLSNGYIFASSLWFIYIAISFIKYQGANFYWPFVYFVNFTVVYALVACHGLQIFKKYERILFVLSAYSLIMYFWQLVALDSLLVIWRFFDLSDGLFQNPLTIYHHAFFYTVHQFIDTSKGAVRNSGFCWEPGAFSCFVVLAIYILVSSNGFNIRKVLPRLAIYIVTLITTQSTTGFLAFAVILFLVMTNKTRGKITSFTGIAVSAIVIFTAYTALPFLGEKIDAQMNDNLQEMAYNQDTDEYQRSLGRFQSFQINLLEFYENPILGIGANESARWASQMNLSVSPTNGVGNILARYGLFGLLPFVFVLFKTSKYYSRIFNYRGSLIFLYLILIVGFSFNVIETPIFLSFILFSIFFKPTKRLSKLQPRQSHHHRVTLKGKSQSNGLGPAQ